MDDYYDGMYSDHSCARSALTALYVEAFRLGKAAGLNETKVKIND